MKRLFFVGLCVLFVGCDFGNTEYKEPRSKSGVTKATVKIKTDENGFTVEQKNIGRRLKIDNEPGSIKHLYLVSSYTGDVILYSTVKGKVTSSGKRLSPYSVAAGRLGNGSNSPDYYGYGIKVSVGGRVYRTSEVLQDDGTYGHSMEYLYWWDMNDIYRQVYVTGGAMPIISSEPLAFPKVILNVDDSWSPKKNKSDDALSSKKNSE
jgi:hypothetical protein